jgi:hypothetical protein
LAPKNLLEKATNFLSDLQALYDLTDNGIDPLQNEILQHISIYPDSTAYDMCRKRALGKDKDERSIRRRISELAEIGLIERIQKEAFQHKAKLCRLTMSGIVYLILKKEIMYNNVIKGILKNYSNNPLFQLFVYPHIRQNTLLQLTSFNSLSPLSLFLYECCRELKAAVDTINSTRSKYLIEQLFVWQSIPARDEHATKGLLKF